MRVFCSPFVGAVRVSLLSLNNNLWFIPRHGKRRRSRKCMTGNFLLKQKKASATQTRRLYYKDLIISGVIDGGWSSWSTWSSCSPDCFHHRRRTCSDPPPSKGGRYCQGLDLETRNCTGGFCQSEFSQSVTVSLPYVCLPLCPMPRVC